MGRFHTIDPLAEWDLKTSPYVYVGNNPILYTDPDGMRKTREEWQHEREERRLRIEKRRAERRGDIFLETAICYGKKKPNKERKKSSRSGIEIRGMGHGWESLATPTTGSVWMVIDFVEMMRVFGLLELTPKIKPDITPNGYKSLGKAVKESLLTSDKEIINETTGISGASKPNNQTIVKTFYGKGKFKSWKGEEGLAKGSEIYQDPSGDSILIVSSKGDSILMTRWTDNNQTRIIIPVEDKK